MFRTIANTLNCTLPLSFSQSTQIQSLNNTNVWRGNPCDCYTTLYNSGVSKLVRCDPIEHGARQAVENCVKVKKGEQVVVITDQETEALADAIALQVVRMDAGIQKFVMEAFGTRSTSGVDPLPFPEEIERAMSKAQASFYIADVRKGELRSFRNPMREAIERYNLRHAHMPLFNEQIMKQGMGADYGEIQRLCLAIYNIVSNAKKIQVTSKAGTDATFLFDNTHRWVIDDGDIKPGKIGNLPAGEVCTCPIDAWGKVVVDGGLGDHFSAKYGALSQTPLSYELKAGRCIHGSVGCVNEELRREFEEYTFQTDKNSNRVGELGIGTNMGLTEIIGNMLQDEKIPGVHIALGSPIPWETGPNWDSAAHNDAMLINPTIIVDGSVVMEGGGFVIDY